MVVRLGRISSMIEQVGRKKKGDINTPLKIQPLGAFEGRIIQPLGDFAL
jgi:hypothetical protein